MAAPRQRDAPCPRPNTAVHLHGVPKRGRELQVTTNVVIDLSVMDVIRIAALHAVSVMLPHTSATTPCMRTRETCHCGEAGPLLEV